MRKLVLFLFLFTSVAFAKPSLELKAVKGHSIAINKTVREIQPLDNPRIAKLLQKEEQAKLVSEAIALKYRGLRFVATSWDFYHLTKLMTSNPSATYRDKTEEFIRSEIDQFDFNGRPMKGLKAMQFRAKYTKTAMAIVAHGYKYVNSLRQFKRLIKYTISNPSLSYKQAMSEFIGKKIRHVVKDGDSMGLLLSIEKGVYYTADALRIKRAGLRLVTDEASFCRLLTIPISTPSVGYKKAVRQFYFDHSGDYYCENVPR